MCTGTGSTSWFFHINHISEEDVRNILDTGELGKIMMVIPIFLPVLSTDPVIRKVAVKREFGRKQYL